MRQVGSGRGCGIPRAKQNQRKKRLKELFSKLNTKIITVVVFKISRLLVFHNFKITLSRNFVVIINCLVPTLLIVIIHTTFTYLVNKIATKRVLIFIVTQVPN